MNDARPQVSERAVFDKMADAVACYERDGTIAYLNPVTAHLFGRPVSELVGQNLWRVFPEAHGAGFREALQRVVDSGISEQVEHFDAPWNRWYVNSVHLADGRLWVIGRDVTDEKSATDQLARLATQLSEAVALRDDFLAVASHELRTPLAALDLQLEGLQRAFESGPSALDAQRTRRKLGMAMRQVDRLATLVDDLLNVSRIATGNLVLEREEFDLASMIGDVVERFEDAFARSGSQITTRIDGSTLVHWDRARLDHALTHVLSNAVKYGAGKEIIVAVDIQDERRVAIAVRDHGIGIAQDEQQRIFERFERAVSSSHYGGLGLGLYLVSQLVRAHGGSIGLTSTLGEGSEFTLLVPRRGVARE